MELVYPAPLSPIHLLSLIPESAVASKATQSDPLIFHDLSGLKVWFFNKVIETLPTQEDSLAQDKGKFSTLHFFPDTHGLGTALKTVLD